MDKIKNIRFQDVEIESGFWKKRYDLNLLVSIKSVYDRFEETGRNDALRFKYKKGGDKTPHIYYDSDVAKWIEAIAYLIEKNGGLEKEQAEIDKMIDAMAENQLDNGYLNSYYIQVEPDKIFSDRTCHELYCAGHLAEAAVAYDRATGKHKFLQIMEKYMDCIDKAFIKDKTAAFATPGHEELELALIKLYDYTKKNKYLDMAMYFIDTRGTLREEEYDFAETNYDQSAVPVRELEVAEGHAVRAVYLYTAMSEAAERTGDQELYAACERLFENIVNKRMYITGGIGSAKLGETFTVDYDLPNLEAYSESCAAIGLALFALSMQQTKLKASYADVIERIMYNNLLSSTSLDGKAFFYENPLEIHLASVDKETSILPSHRVQLPIRHRVEVFECSCCPPNINRIFARIGDFFFSEYDDNLIINQYGAVGLKNEKITLTMKTDYPVNGKIKFSVKGCQYKKILLRKPFWCDEYFVSGTKYKLEGDYIYVEPVEKFEAEFNMKPYFVQANPCVRADSGRIALMYGPTVYCLERIDNPYELNALFVSPKARFKKVKTENYLLPDLETEGFVDENFSELYRKASDEREKVKLRFRPYWTFANRQECDMLIWIRRC